MIKNDRQYRLTKVQGRLFETAIKALDHNTGETPDLNPVLLRAQRQAIASQIDELNSEVFEYEALKSGKIKSFEAQSLSELPSLLVKARIASGMMHKDLAAKLNVKEQQVQRWESNDFAGASLENLTAIADALGVVLVQKVFVPDANVTGNKFLASLEESGIKSDFVLKRILSPKIADIFRNDSAGLKEIVDAASSVARVFGLKMRDIVELKTPQLDFSVVASTRFKLPARANKNTVSGYTVYAHYLAALLSNSLEQIPKQKLPIDSGAIFRQLSENGNPITFEKLAILLWDCGVIILPLREAGEFHGAVWKISERFIIALKQTTPLDSRWLFDCLHEYAHIVNGDVTDDASLIEDEEISPETTGDEEEAANEWAEKTLFNGKSEVLEDACTNLCKGRLQNLKSVVPKVAEKFNVNVGSLANHMAHRLAQQNENWWGAAHNLQTTGRNPYEIAREMLIKNVNFSQLNAFDRELLQRALSDP